jgi:cellobiose-specific phosphotransferase system component IIC
MIVIRIILGLMIIAGSVALMKYVVPVTNFTGKIDFAEKYLGNPLAGTYTFYRLFAVCMIILAVLWMFGRLSFLPI